MTQERLQRYYTPQWMVFVLFEFLADIGYSTGTMLDPCAGAGAIIDVAKHMGWATCAGDVDPLVVDSRKWDHHWDFVGHVQGLAKGIDAHEPDPIFMKMWQWIITNPPYLLKQVPKWHALDFIEASQRVARHHAHLLRMTIAEPCTSTHDRRPSFLHGHRPFTRTPAWELKLPRASFTADGKKDMASCSWFIWLDDWDEDWWKTKQIWPQDIMKLMRRIPAQFQVTDPFGHDNDLSSLPLFARRARDI